MQIAPAIVVRNKMMGALLRHVRVRAGKSAQEMADVMSTPADTVAEWENGQQGIPLSRLEAWAHVCGVPISFFWDENPLPAQDEVTEPVAQIMGIRRKMVGVLLQQSRLIAARSVEEVAAEAGVSPETLKACEAGMSELAVTQLELAAQACGVSIRDFFDERLFPITDEERRVQEMQQLQALPDDVREFVLKPSNVLYLRLSMQLSGLSAGTLRQIAETILDITF